MRAGNVIRCSVVFSDCAFSDCAEADASLGATCAIFAVAAGMTSGKRALLDTAVLTRTSSLPCCAGVLSARCASTSETSRILLVQGSFFPNQLHSSLRLLVTT